MKKIKNDEMVLVVGGLCNCFGKYTLDAGGMFHEHYDVPVFVGAVTYANVCKDNIVNLTSTDNELSYVGCFSQDGV